jgi:hypothetical protein
MHRGDDGRLPERAGRARWGGRAPAAGAAAGAFVPALVPALGLTLGLTLGLAFSTPFPAHAGTTGKLSGRILDASKKPVSFAAVMLVGTRMGNNTDAEGRYNIINVCLLSRICG